MVNVDDPDAVPDDLLRAGDGVGLVEGRLTVLGVVGAQEDRGVVLDHQHLARRRENPAVDPARGEAPEPVGGGEVGHSIPSASVGSSRVSPPNSVSTMPASWPWDRSHWANWLV